MPLLRFRAAASPSIVSDPGEPPAPAELERVASDAALAAAEIVTAAYGQPRPVGQKSSPTDVVTQTDLRAEERVRQVLQTATPQAGILGEEGGTTAPGVRLQWVIDPLDGTINFLYGVPLFAVSVAAAIDGEVVAGAVVDVLRGELFSAHRGGGARRDGEPITVSQCSSLPQALVTTGFSYSAELREVQGEVAHQLLSRARDLRCFGSTALELCWVACARVDAYFQRDTEIWDRAAGALIAEEAGARIEMPCPENDELVIAAGPAIFEELRAAVQPAAA
jgi:myo-inositol-1(or 4)-monophosphatase